VTTASSSWWKSCAPLPAFVPELSLVAEAAGKVVGYILFTRIHIQSEAGPVEALALAPVAVPPEFQHQGIGGRLILEGHRRALNLGFSAVLLLGHAGYYPRFGYRPACQFGIKLPFDVPDENCMALELRPEGLRGVHGEVLYSPPFYE
jgi:predicted N-acetyltransferase YhbS